MDATVDIRWIGQSGYAITHPSGAVCLIDAYLSDYAEEQLGVQRVIAPPIDPARTPVDVVVCTHWHEDHLDRPTCLAIAQASPHARFVGPPSVSARLRSWGVAPERVVTLAGGEAIDVGPFRLHGTFARHEVAGWLSEDAIGVVLEAAGVRIAHSGDTEYDSRCLAVRDLGAIDVACFVVNGEGGNMSAPEAALMAHQVAPGLAIPCHYGMWSADHSAAAVFREYCDRLGGPAARVLEVGETLAVTPRGAVETPGG